MIRDLNSTNGTFVNGERLVGPRVLEPGDRIMIGDRTVTFCQVDPVLGGDADVSGDMDTVAYASDPTKGDCDALKGSLEQIPAFALLQLLEMGMKTGVLEIRRGADERRIWFQSGVPVHAACGTSSGLEAALAIVRPVDGQFTFHADQRAPTRTIQCSVAELLLEASRRRDEVERR